MVGLLFFLFLCPFFCRRKCLYLPWTFSWWTVLSIDNAGHSRHFIVDCLLENFVLWRNLAVAAVVRHVIPISGVEVAVEARLGSAPLRLVLPLVPENSPHVFGDEAATSEGLCKSSRED